MSLRPAAGLWNLNEALEVRVAMRNIGQVPVAPAVRMESEASPSDQVASDAVLVPGARTEIVVPFQSKTPWQDGTGDRYHSNVTAGVTILSDQTAGAKTIQVDPVVADLPRLVLPAWLGTKPPGEGDWVRTLDEEFVGEAIDPHRWNVHPQGNWWDKRMHFSKDQIIVRDGCLHLRLEKKPGRENDDPRGTFTAYSAAGTTSRWTMLNSRRTSWSGTSVSGNARTSPRRRTDPNQTRAAWTRSTKFRPPQARSPDAAR